VFGVDMDDGPKFGISTRFRRVSLRVLNFTCLHRLRNDDVMIVSTILFLVTRIFNHTTGKV